MTDHHHHHHHPHHDHGHDYANANKEYFNANDDWSKLAQVDERAERIIKTLVKLHTFDKEKATAMEFACGDGAVSKKLLPYVKSILGVDISERMIERYNEKLKDEENASAVCIELKGEEGELSNARFDLIICTSAYHHFADATNITRILASFLNPGGVLLVADIIHKAEGYEFLEEHKDIVPHKHGFDKNDMNQFFNAAGLGLKTFEIVPSVSEHEHPDPDIFIAIGEKPLA